MADTQWTRTKIHKSKPLKKEKDRMKLSGFFDDLFENNKEGFETTSPAPTTKVPTTKVPTTKAPTTTPTKTTLQDKIDDKLNATSKSETNVSKSVGSEISNLKAELSNLSSDIEQLNSIGSEFGLVSGKMDAGLDSAQNLKYLNSLNFTGGLTKSISEVAGLIKMTIQSLVSYLILAKKTIELFILEFNQNLTEVITKMSNALTQGTATIKEIDIFQQQTQMFIFIMTVWMFVYNWYYVFFYLEKEDGIRYTFETASLQDYSETLYGAFGPSIKLVEWINWGLVTISNKVKHGVIPLIEQKIPNAIIYVFLFVMFAILVSSDFQSILIVDFFKALQHDISPSSILYITSAISISFFAINYFFRESGIGEYLYNLFGWLTFVPYIILLFFYVGWTTSVSIPLGVIFLIGYLVMNFFFAVFYYEGFNAMNIFSGVSEDIAPIGPDINAGDVCFDYESPSWWEYITTRPSVVVIYLWHYFKRIINYITAYMFEIIIVLLLLGGIGTYSANFQNAIAGKVGMSAFSTSSVKQAFKQLFTWLIMINIIIIVLIVMFAYRKYRQIQSLTPSLTKGTGTINMAEFNEHRRAKMGGMGGMEEGERGRGGMEGERGMEGMRGMEGRERGMEGRERGMGGVREEGMEGMEGMRGMRGMEHHKSR